MSEQDEEELKRLAQVSSIQIEEYYEIWKKEHRPTPTQWAQSILEKICAKSCEAISAGENCVIISFEEFYHPNLMIESNKAAIYKAHNALRDAKNTVETQIQGTILVVRWAWD